MACPKMSVAFLTAVVLACMAAPTEAQTNATCAQSLVPCGSYLNSTEKPPETCCDPIREAIATQKQCLCQLYKTPGLLESLGATLSQALRLTKACSVDADTSLCRDDAPSPAEDPSPTGLAGNGVAGVKAWTVVSSLLLSAAFAMLN